MRKSYLIRSGHELSFALRQSLRADIRPNHPKLHMGDRFFDSHEFYFAEGDRFLGVFGKAAK